MKTITSIIAIPLILLGLFILMRVLMCGPNSADVKVMKPMGDAISSYILKHGIPESLEDIPGLPYEVEGCKKVEKYHEECSYGHYSISLYKFIEGSYTLKLFSPSSQTGIRYSFDVDKNNNVSLENDSHGNPKIYDSKTSGICNPMRQ